MVDNQLIMLNVGELLVCNNDEWFSHGQWMLMANDD